MIIESTPDSPTDNSFLKWSLAFYGAPLLIEKSYNRTPSQTATLLAALEKGRKDASINSILPFFIYLNFENLNWSKIISQTTQLSYLGYLLHLLFDISHDKRTLEVLGKIQSKTKNIKKRTTPLIETNRPISPFARKKYESTINEAATSWAF